MPFIYLPDELQIQISGNETLATFATWAASNDGATQHDTNVVEADRQPKIQNGAIFDTSLGTLIINHRVEGQNNNNSDSGIWKSHGGSVIVQGSANQYAEWWAVMDFDRCHWIINKTGGQQSFFRSNPSAIPISIQRSTYIQNSGGIDGHLQFSGGTGEVKDTYFENKAGGTRFLLLRDSDSDGVSLIGIDLGGWSSLTQPTTFHKNMTFDHGTGSNATKIVFYYRRNNYPIFYNIINQADGKRMNTISYKAFGSDGKSGRGIVVGKFEPILEDQGGNLLEGVKIEIRKISDNTLEQSGVTATNGKVSVGGDTNSISWNGRVINEEGILYVKQSITPTTAGAVDSADQGDFLVRMRRRDLVFFEATQSFKEDFDGVKIVKTDELYTAGDLDFTTVTDINTGEEFYNFYKYYNEKNMDSNLSINRIENTVYVGDVDVRLNPAFTEAFVPVGETIEIKTNSYVGNGIITTGTVFVFDGVDIDGGTFSTVHMTTGKDLKDVTINGDLVLNDPFNKKIEFDNVIVTGSITNLQSGNIEISWLNLNVGDQSDPRITAYERLLTSSVQIIAPDNTTEWAVYRNDGSRTSHDRGSGTYANQEGDQGTWKVVIHKAGSYAEEFTWEANDGVAYAYTYKNNVIERLDGGNAYQGQPTSGVVTEKFGEKIRTLIPDQVVTAQNVVDSIQAFLNTENGLDVIAQYGYLDAPTLGFINGVLILKNAEGYVYDSFAGDTPHAKIEAVFQDGSGQVYRLTDNGGIDAGVTAGGGGQADLSKVERKQDVIDENVKWIKRAMKSQGSGDEIVKEETKFSKETSLWGTDAVVEVGTDLGDWKVQAINAEGDGNKIIAKVKVPLLRGTHMTRAVVNVLVENMGVDDDGLVIADFYLNEAGIAEDNIFATERTLNNVNPGEINLVYNFTHREAYYDNEKEFAIVFYGEGVNIDTSIYTIEITKLDLIEETTKHIEIPKRQEVDVMEWYHDLVEKKGYLYPPVTVEQIDSIEAGSYIQEVTVTGVDGALGIVFDATGLTFPAGAWDGHYAVADIGTAKYKNLIISHGLGFNSGFLIFATPFPEAIAIGSKVFILFEKAATLDKIESDLQDVKEQTNKLTFTNENYLFTNLRAVNQEPTNGIASIKGDGGLTQAQADAIALLPAFDSKFTTLAEKADIPSTEAIAISVWANPTVNSLVVKGDLGPLAKSSEIVTAAAFTDAMVDKDEFKALAKTAELTGLATSAEVTGIQTGIADSVWEHGTATTLAYKTDLANLATKTDVPSAIAIGNDLVARDEFTALATSAGVTGSETSIKSEVVTLANATLEALKARYTA